MSETVTLMMYSSQASFLCELCMGRQIYKLGLPSLDRHVIRHVGSNERLIKLHCGK